MPHQDMGYIFFLLVWFDLISLNGWIDEFFLETLRSTQKKKIVD